MTHNKYFFSGRMVAVRQTPGGGNVSQEFVPESIEAGPHEKDVLPVSQATDPYGARSFGMNPMLLESIRMSDLFWDLAKFTKFEEVVDQIYFNCVYATPWVPGTHQASRNTGMQSAVRGVSNAGTPGTMYTILLKLYIMQLTRQQIKSMLNHTDSPFIKAAGLLYLRIGMADGFKEIWSWFEPLIDDKEQFCIDGTPATKTTIGEYVRRLLTDQDYFGDRLPRLPVLVQRQIDANLKAKDTGQPLEAVIDADRKRGREEEKRGREEEKRGREEEKRDQNAGQASAGRAEVLRRKREEIAQLEVKVASIRQLIADKTRAQQR
uniref:Pre-mRNA-splicing factor 38 n=1 Tax=Chrysotila carterae TaxID=13221 RepID=A0A7S4ET65_CHRCT|mmetsp:Transcript_40349/g.88579  ORF Transcript_40349/g.88579 Transcript_40349/m.88579 type:complete len:321 (+) Transcript_40349:369-1331(+)